MTSAAAAFASAFAAFVSNEFVRFLRSEHSPALLSEEQVHQELLDAESSYVKWGFDESETPRGQVNSWESSGAPDGLPGHGNVDPNRLRRPAVDSTLQARV